MKLLFTCLMASGLFFLMACADGEADKATNAQTETLTPDNVPSSSAIDLTANTTAPPVTTPASDNASPDATKTAGAEPHYVCPNKCAGSGGASAGACPVCGSQYEHNTAFHNQPAGQQTPTIQQNAQSQSQVPAPAQNDAGVYHYTCSKGCAGGSGTAGKCSGCGGELAHNAAFHN